MPTGIVYEPYGKKEPLLQQNRVKYRIGRVPKPGMMPAARGTSAVLTSYPGAGTEPAAFELRARMRPVWRPSPTVRRARRPVRGRRPVCRGPRGPRPSEEGSREFQAGCRGRTVMSRLPTSRPTGVLTGVDHDEGRRRSVGVGGIPRGESYAPLLHVAGDALGLRAFGTPSGGCWSGSMQDSGYELRRTLLLLGTWVNNRPSPRCDKLDRLAS